MAPEFRIACLTFAALLVGLGGSPPVRADDSETIKDLACTFDSGTSSGYEAGKFTSKPAAPLAFKLSKIDLEGQSAELTAGTAELSAKIRIVRAINANHFLEVVNEGFLNLTTVYDADAKTGLRPAVHSRHLGLLGQPVFGQYTGTCKDN